jgi:putative toxin-antitoxin system antitoxin component (TIGR02293 family)
MSKKTNVLEEPLIGYYTTDDREIFKLIDTVKDGIKYSSFASLMKQIPFTLIEWSNYLNISDRTLQRYSREKKTFDRMQSERIIEITMLYKFGTAIFGSKLQFDEWLSTKNVSLGRKAPKDFLDSSLGIGLLKDALARIEHGILA